MKSLKRVQTLAKVLKILFTIAFVGCIVGLVLSLVGCILTPFIANIEKIQDFLKENGAEFNFNRYMATCVCSAVSCAVWIYLTYKNCRFYKFELEVGTPFDKKVVSMIRKLGIEAIVACLAVNIVEAIICIPFNVEAETIINMSEVGVGIVYLLISLILDYGADVNEQKEITENVDDKESD